MTNRFNRNCLWAIILLPAATMALGQAAAESSPATGEKGIKDTEQIIDVAEISKAVQDSTKPLYETLSQTRLKERFAAVQTTLRQPKVDKDELLASLKDLKSGIDSFTDKWESIVDPLWAGQETLAKAISDIRKKVPAAGKGKGQLPKRVQTALAKYDRRLHDLAVRIKASRDETSKKRLTRVFRNLLSLREFTERLGSAGVEKVKIKLMLRTVQVLTRLQDQLLDATFELEKVRSILVGESEFITDYISLLEMSRSAGDLVAMLRQMRTAGGGIGGVSSNVNDVRHVSTGVAKALEDFSGSILDDLEKELDKLAEDAPEQSTGLSEAAGNTAGGDKDIEVKIEQYSVRTLISQETVVE